jgi:hypothetical protein
MRAPTSVILAEIYVQYIEHTYICNILHKHNISIYHRYVDHILIIYETSKTNITNTLNELSNIKKNINFTIEHENNNINVLDITINRENYMLNYKICRKPTIHNTSCHPHEHKIASFNYLYNRVNTYPLTQNNIRHETNTIKEIAHENGYKDLTIHEPHRKHIL